MRYTQEDTGSVTSLCIKSKVAECKKPISKTSKIQVAWLIVRIISAEAATFSTTNHDVHRIRRGALNKFFSRAQVSRLEPTIRDMAECLCEKILTVGKREPFDVTTAYSLFTTDVISGYCLGESLGLIAQDGWEPNFREPLYAQLRLVYLFRFIPFLKRAGVALAM